MKNIMLILSSILILLNSSTVLSAQREMPKEVLIIGTMHDVPTFLKNSYRPLLKKAKKYAPQAIYVERPMASDTLSIKNSLPKFYASIDSLQQIWKLDEEAVQLAKSKALEEMSRDDFFLLYQYYSLQMDFANKEYFSYLYYFGLEGSPKPMRNENTDLTAKLAIDMGHTEIFSMDNQWNRRAYGRAWYQCTQSGKKDKELKYQTRLAIRYTLREYANVLIGRYGAYTNSKKTQAQYHTVNSFRYRKTTCEPCDLGTSHWDSRNLEMARNIGNQIRQQNHERSVIVVGSGHAVGLQEVLEKEFPEIKVKLYREL